MVRHRVQRKWPALSLHFSNYTFLMFQMKYRGVSRGDNQHAHHLISSPHGLHDVVWRTYAKSYSRLYIYLKSKGVSPVHLENLNNLGLEALKKRDWVSSETYFSKSLKLDEKQPTILYMLGQSQRFLNKFPKAIVSLQKAISLQKHHKEWHLALGIAQQLNDQLDDSINAFRTANAIDLDYELPYNSAAISFRKKGDYIKADEVYDKGLISIARKFPENSTIFGT
jgi:tetratricopeptide (TPR) repeat protein